jgi:hypothetical protein
LDGDIEISAPLACVVFLGKNRRLVDGQLEKKEKGKEEKNDCEAVIFPCRAIFYHP